MNKSAFFYEPGLIIIGGILLIAMIGLMVPFIVYGAYFIVFAFAFLCVVAAGLLVSIVLGEISFFMLVIAIFFMPKLWSTIGGMWIWLWSWVSPQLSWLWPHLVKSLPIYLISGIGLFLLYYFYKQVHKDLKKILSA